ncbi:MAG: FAD-dependent oxidoreductase [Hyphomicrobiales bacterium]
MASSDPLLQPYQLKHLTLRNRFMSTAHEPNYHHDGMPKEQYRLYHVEKAKGGIALTMTAGSAIVSPDSPPAFGNLHAYRDEIVPYMKQLTDEVKEHGSAVMIQITHLGRRGNWNHSDWLPVLAPSPVREPAHRSFPKEIEDWDIERIIKDYAVAAQRMKEGGMDGIEFEAYGHLMDAFWSPEINLREDEYGPQNLDNRLRFSFRVIDAVRDAVGPDFIVGVRLVCDEIWERGISREDGVEIAQRLVATGKVDFLNVIRGRIISDAQLTKVIPVSGMASAPHLDFSGEVRQATKFPVFHAARIGDVATARHAIAEGKLDMVGMTRAHIADPYIAAKTAAGKEHEIRPCVGATYCLDRIYEGHSTLCIHNAATGREATMPHIISRTHGPPKNIVIVGAGPAGLEAARVAAEQDHGVTLFEASNNPGGQIKLATKLKRRAELIGIADWRAERCEALGVTLRFNTYAEPEDIRALSPDVVIVATGGIPQTPPLDNGEELAVSTWDILSGDTKPAESVLLFDDNGQHPGLTAAEFIARAGSDMEIVTPERFFAPDVGGLNYTPYARAFHETGTVVTISTYVRALERRGNKIAATLYSDFTETDVGERLVDQVVVEYGTRAHDELYFALKEESTNRGEVDHGALIEGRPQSISTNPEGAFQLFRIGDAVASRNIHAAIYDALRLVKDF